MNFRKKSKGITLIALVITIIVLLILAGVSLNLVLGNQGILNQATSAVDEYKKANIAEEIELAKAELSMAYYSNKDVEPGESLNDYILRKLNGYTLPSGATLSKTEDGSYTHTDKSGNATNITIDNNLNVGVGNTEQNQTPVTPTPPDPEEPQEPDPEPTKYTISYNSNCEVSAPESTEGEEDDVINLPTLTREGYNFLGWAEDENATTSQYTNTFTVGTSNVTLYAVWITIQSYNAQHPELHIPTGFQYKEGSWSEGYVITDSVAADKSGGNEFVWIPVANDEAYEKKLGTYNYYLKTAERETADSLSNVVSNGIRGDVLGVSDILGKKVTSTLDANSPEYEVVKNAGGFWVGRYETGTTAITAETTTTWANSTAKDRLVVKAGMQPARMIYQTQALSLANSWRSGEADLAAGTVKFQSGLITGAQWDAMCKFIDWATCDSDCINWGNYYGAVGASYIGYHSNNAANDWVSDTITKNGSVSHQFVFPTGKFVHSGKTDPSTVKKNIYDIAGNVWEWTTEVPQYSASNGVLRGGGVNVDGSIVFATRRNGDCSSTTRADFNDGFRIVLYVE